MRKRYVMNHRWPGWAARKRKDPLAERIVDVLQEAKGPIPLVELPGRIKGSDPDEVRSAVDKLITHLVLFEDAPARYVGDRGGLPPGRPRGADPRQQASRTAAARGLRAPQGDRAGGKPDRQRPSRLPPRGRERAAAAPPGPALFQKEVERFQAPLEPLPPWLLEALRWSDEGRLNQALAWSRALQLAEEVVEGKQIRLQLTSKGHKVALERPR